MHSKQEGQALSQEATVKIGDYVVGKTIGEGTFNKVKIGRHIHSQEQVAIKLIDKAKINSEGDRQRLNKQLKILRKVRHPNIIQLFQILEDSKYYYVVTEYASRGELFDHIVAQEKLSEFQAARFLQQLLGAIEYLQEMGVVHRDLKPQNVLLDYKYNVKLVDFGLSNVFARGQTLTTACGSPCYAAPEMLSGQPYNPLKVDIWSAGVVLYAMCFGYLPFDNPDAGELYRTIREGSYEVPSHASEDLTNLLTRMLNTDPLQRATIDEIRSHAFCIFSPQPKVSGIIPGLSVIPFEVEMIEQMQGLGLQTSDLQGQIANNKHNHLTATYYLFLQQWLRTNNQSLLSYYTSKHALINRHIVVEKVKQNYERRLAERLEQMARSRHQRKEVERKKRSKTQKKGKGGPSSGSKFNSKEIYLSPEKRKKIQFRHSSAKANPSTKRKRKLSRL